MYNSIDLYLLSFLQELQVDTGSFVEDDSFRFDFTTPEPGTTSTSTFQGQSHTSTFTEPVVYEGTVNFTLEKDVGKMLFPDSASVMTSQASNTQKYTDTSSTFAEMAFRGFPSTSEQCIYSSHPYGDSAHVHPHAHAHSQSSDKLYQRDTSSTQSAAFSSTSESLTHGMFQPQPMQQTYGDPSVDNKLNINVNIYQSQQLPQAHAHQLEEAAILRRSESRQSVSRYPYGSYNQPIYGSASALQGTSCQGLQSMETGYPVMDRWSPAGRHYSRRPSLTIPMPPHTPER